MYFSETCIYQVKPDKVEDFEVIAKEIEAYFTGHELVQEIAFIKRTHRLADYQEMKQGVPTVPIKRIVKSVKYMMQVRLLNEIDHGQFCKELFEVFDKRIAKCVLAPGDKYVGYKL